MLIKKAGLLVLFATFFIVVLGYGQKAPGNGERIQQLRDEIAMRESPDVPADLVELNRSKLIERRAELRTLLKVEIDNLRKHRNVMGSSLTREESQKIDDSVQSYLGEVARLGDAIQRDLAADASNPQMIARSGIAAPKAMIAPLGMAPLIANPLPTPSPSPSPTPTPTPIPIPNIAPATAETDATTSTAHLNCDDVNNSKIASSGVDKIICGLVRSIPTEAQKRANNQLPLTKHVLTRDDFWPLVKILIAKKDTPAFLVEAEETRLDKEVGTANASSAGTSLVTKGGAPAILGFAVENGALTQNVNGSIITFRGNPVGIVNALKDKGVISTMKEQQNDAVLSFLKKTSFGFSFNTDRGNTPGVFTATRQQLAAVSARLELINKRRPELYIKEWEDFLSTKAQALANRVNADQDQNLFMVTGGDESVFPYGQFKDPALQTWFIETQRQLETATDATLSAVLQDRLAKLPVRELQPDTVLYLTGIEKQLGIYVSGRDELLKKINHGTVVTLEYLNKREVNAPNTSKFTFIAEKGTGGGKLDFTFNGSLTMFDNLDSLKTFVKANPTLPAPRRLRDFSFVGQMDMPLGSVRDFGQFVVFANGRYERLLENATTDLGNILPNTKGDVASFQFGLKVPIKGTGFKIPISMTFANRSELVKEKEVRGNFGFTLDLDTLFSKFKPF